ncbi:MAG: hypothetical protein AAF959_20185 [Cyanobacteria bacterium P01_D01_bin.56]
MSQPSLMVLSVASVFAFAFLSIGIYIFNIECRNTLAFVMPTLAASGILSSMLCVSQSLWMDINYRRDAKALEYIARWNQATYEKSQLAVNRIALAVSGKSEEFTVSMIKKELSDPEKLFLVQRVFNFFEELAMVRETANEKMLRDFYIDIVISYYNLFGGWINEVSKLRIYDSYEIYKPVKDLYQDWIGHYVETIDVSLDVTK